MEGEESAEDELLDDDEDESPWWPPEADELLWADWAELLDVEVGTEEASEHEDDREGVNSWRRLGIIKFIIISLTDSRIIP